jgi:RimJ/RimL family protein N-acetyltransferase
VRIEAPRTRLRCWQEADREAFAALNADPEVMRDLGGPISREQSDAKLDRYVAAFNEHGFCRWVVESPEGNFLGYAGVMPANNEHPLGFHYDIGWRLVRRSWGLGYATDAARAALKDVFTRTALSEILSYTTAENIRSQAVMERVGLHRDPTRDFTTFYDGVGAWRGLVWIARRNLYAAGLLRVKPSRSQFGRS